MARANPVLLGRLGALILRLLGMTLRWRISDDSGFTRGELPGPLIVPFWHNRMLLLPLLWKQIEMPRPVSGLTSTSKDGEITAQIMLRFGVQPIRGSSSKKGTAALREMITRLKNGHVICVVPDGPRGPKYHFQKGTIFLAQATGARIMPITCEISRCLRLKSWDGFMIPLPFSRIDAHFGAPISVERTEDEHGLEQERARLEAVMMDSLITR